ncbi:MAG: hypothetical protein LE169_05690 [Endomicrobium sp.]|nr:hypothetical protein [Endomicrobium sp.]
MKKLIAVSLVAILISGCGKSAIPLSEPKPIPLFETEPLYSMTPLDSDSDEDIRNDRDNYFQHLTIVVASFGVTVFISRIKHLIDGSMSLSELFTEVIFASSGVFWAFSSLYGLFRSELLSSLCSSFCSDESYKKSHWYMIAKTSARLCLLSSGTIGLF